MSSLRCGCGLASAPCSAPGRSRPTNAGAGTPSADGSRGPPAGNPALAPGRPALLTRCATEGVPPKGGGAAAAGPAAPRRSRGDPSRVSVIGFSPSRSSPNDWISGTAPTPGSRPRAAGTRPRVAGAAGVAGAATGALGTGTAPSLGGDAPWYAAGGCRRSGGSCGGGCPAAAAAARSAMIASSWLELSGATRISVRTSSSSSSFVASSSSSGSSVRTAGSGCHSSRARRKAAAFVVRTERSRWNASSRTRWRSSSPTSKTASGAGEELPIRCRVSASLPPPKALVPVSTS